MQWMYRLLWNFAVYSLTNVDGKSPADSFSLLWIISARCTLQSPRPLKWNGCPLLDEAYKLLSRLQDSFNVPCDFIKKTVRVRETITKLLNLLQSCNPRCLRRNWLARATCQTQPSPDTFYSADRRPSHTYTRRNSLCISIWSSLKISQTFWESSFVLRLDAGLNLAKCRYHNLTTLRTFISVANICMVSVDKGFL